MRREDMQTTLKDGMPTVKLSTGVRVANFSSPHEFEFTDGSVLAACDEDRSRRLTLTQVERTVKDCASYKLVTVEHEMSIDVRNALFSAAKYARRIGIDLIIVPFPVLRAMAKDGDPVGNSLSQQDIFVTIRMADRVKKINHHDVFCTQAEQQL
jgi:hypothetical protein